MYLNVRRVFGRIAHIAASFRLRGAARIPYPDNCLRGIPGADKVREQVLVDSDVFMFDDNHRKRTGELEQSVNWEDDDGVIPFTLAQTRDDSTFQFRGGVAVIARAELDRLSRLPVFGGFSYERKRLAENRYHGNLILSAGVSKLRKKAIAAALAVAVSRIIPQPPSPPAATSNR
jgi:hypothetical protein